MNTPTRDFVTVDMRGLKVALVARARSERAAVSVVVRRAIERELGPGDAAGEAGVAITSPAETSSTTVKLSLRMTRAEAELLAAGARRAGLSRGAFLGGLLANVPSLSGDAGVRLECLAALTASNAELSTLTRNLHHLTALLRQGDVHAARGYRRIFDTLDGDVRAHLSLAASVLAHLQPTRRPRGGSTSPRRTIA